MHEDGRSDITPTNRTKLRWLPVLLIVCTFLAIGWNRFFAPRLSPQGYGRLRVGMTRSEVYAMIGESHHERAVVGYVNEGSLTTNDATNRRELLKQGYSDFVYEVWWSPDLSVNVAFDREGRLACFYSSDGQKRTLLGILWPKERAVLPPPVPGKP